MFCSLQTQGIGVMYSAVTRTRPAQWACTQTDWKPKSGTLAPFQHQRWFQCTVRLLNLWRNSLILGQTLTLKVIPRLRSTDVLVWEIPSWASWMQSGGSRSLACKQSSVYIHPLFCPSYYMARRHGCYVSRTATGSNPSIWRRNVESLASDGSYAWQTPPFRRQQAWWNYHSSLPTDLTTCSATSVVYPRKLLFGEPCNGAPTSLTVTAQLRNGSVLEVALDGRGCSSLKRISEPPSVSPTSQPKTGQTGDRYDPPPVLRISEWVSEWVGEFSNKNLEQRIKINKLLFKFVATFSYATERFRTQHPYI